MTGSNDSDYGAFADAFSPSPSQPIGKGKRKGKDYEDQPQVRRKALRHYDLVPMQLINPMGESGVGVIDLVKLWELLNNGNKGVECFSNLCFEDAARRNIGISQLSEVLMHLCNRVTTCKYLPMLLRPEVLTAVKAEAERLYPLLKLLNQGPQGRTPSTQTIRAAAYASSSSNSRTPETIAAQRQAAKELRKWLCEEKSKLRGMTHALSGNGIFFVAQTHEKAARAYVHHGSGSEEAFLSAVESRQVAGLANVSAGGDYEELQ